MEVELCSARLSASHSQQCFSHTKSASILFSNNKSASATNHSQPNKAMNMLSRERGRGGGQDRDEFAAS